jgi:hypothetical protein
MNQFFKEICVGNFHYKTEVLYFSYMDLYTRFHTQFFGDDIDTHDVDFVKFIDYLSES